MKPLDAAYLNEKISDETLIPPLPESIIRAKELIKDENSSINDIARLIENEPSITAKILRIANSPYYGFARKVDNIETALIVLGLKATFEIIQSVALISNFSGIIDRPFLNRFVRHSVLLAVLTRELSRFVGADFHGSEYTAGLLHDVGLALIRAIAPEHSRLLEEHFDPFTVSCGLEMDLIGVNHCQAGKKLAELWQLPDHLVTVIETHHESLDADEGITIPSIIRLAERIADNGSVISSSGNDRPILTLPENHFAGSVDMKNLADRIKNQEHEIMGIAGLLAA